MTNPVRVAYLLVLGALVVVGYLFISAPWWVLAVIGIAMMVPVAVADINTSKRPTSTSTSG